MSDLAERESPVPPLLRDRSGVQRVTNIELFFDLVYAPPESQASRETRLTHSYLFRLIWFGDGISTGKCPRSMLGSN